MAPRFCYDNQMERFTPNKEKGVEKEPGDLTPEQEVDLREALASIGTIPNSEKKSPPESREEEL
jgi:hypothetical protein